VKDEAFRNGEKLKLTPTEYRLLKLFASHPEKLFSRDLLLDYLWDHEFSAGTRVVDMHIRNLSRKLRSEKYLIQTVWGFGYRMRRMQ
jgi:DNA-binding response OmpR family regulator